METIYDWLALAIFSGLIVLFLQRSMAEEKVDTVWHYLPPAVGCAFGNWLGNQGHAILAVFVLVLTVAYIVVVLRPSMPRR